MLPTSHYNSLVPVSSPQNKQRFAFIGLHPFASHPFIHLSHTSMYCRLLMIVFVKACTSGRAGSHKKSLAVCPLLSTCLWMWMATLCKRHRLAAGHFFFQIFLWHSCSSTTALLSPSTPSTMKREGHRHLLIKTRGADISIS